MYFDPLISKCEDHDNHMINLGLYILLFLVIFRDLGTIQKAPRLLLGHITTPAMPLKHSTE